MVKILQELGVRGMCYPARILLLEGASGSSSCMCQNTRVRVVNLMVAEWASIAPILPDMLVILSSHKLSEPLPLEPLLDVFILVVHIVR